MAGKQDLTEPHEGDERYVRPNESRKFTETDDLSDTYRDVMGTSASGQGDRTDRTRKGDQSSSTDSSRTGSSGKSSKPGKSTSMRGAAARRNRGGMGGSGDPDNR